MKTKISAAILFAVSILFLASCGWLFGKKENPVAPVITGVWKVDSMYNTAKDSAKNSLAFLMFSGTNPVHTVEFKTDSTWKIREDSSSQWEKYYVKDSSLFVAEDSSFAPYKMNFLKDSSLLLTSEDSLVIVLKRK